MSGRLHAQLSTQILAHIRDSRLPPGQHLPEQALADLFRVSRAPVRAALKALEASGAVRLERNRGFFVLDPGNAAPPAPADEDEPYLAIASDRLDGKLPERVTENELIRRYGMTRPHAARTMARVAQEGWAERLPGRGWAFTPTLTSREAYDHGYRFRAAIESAALLEPGFSADPAALARLRDEQLALLDGELEHAPAARLFAVNAGFHERVLEWSGNPFFVDALRRVNQVRRLMEYRLTVDRGRLPRQCREHLELLDMIEGGDLVTASAFLRVHIGTARRIKTAGLA